MRIPSGTGSCSSNAAGCRLLLQGGHVARRADLADAGGAELEELSHELQRASDPALKEVAKELAADAASEGQTPA